MAYRIKRVHKAHLYQVATENGLSERLVDDIVKAYIRDMQDSLKAGESITVPGLFSISYTKFDNGYIELRGSVSSTIKKEVRGY